MYRFFWVYFSDVFYIYIYICVCVCFMYPCNLNFFVILKLMCILIIQKSDLLWI